MPSRRSLLGSLGALATGGCLLSAEKCFQVWTDDKDPVEYYVDQLPKYEGVNFEEVIASAPETVRKSAPFRFDGPFVYGGDIYRINVVDQSFDEHWELTAVFDPAEGGPGVGNTSSYQFENLPPVDRDRIDAALGNGSWEDGAPGDQETVETTLTYPDGTANSTVAGLDEIWIERRNQTYRVSINDRAKDREAVYFYRAEAVTESDIREILDDEYLLQFENLSDGEREILAAAREGEYERCGDTGMDLTQAEQSLRNRLPEAETLPGDRIWYVEAAGERSLLHWAGGISEP